MASTSTMKRIINGLFLVVLCVPAIAVMHSPQLRPAVRAVVENPAEWDHQRDALRRTTPLWNKAVEGYSQLLYLLGTTNMKDIGVVGEQGWIFLGDSLDHNMSQALGRRVYSPQEVQRWADTLKEQQTWLSRRGIPMLFVVAPAKWSIYPDRLPEWTHGHIGAHSLDLLLAAPEQLPLIDLRPALRAERALADTYSPLNSHWTDYGALVAWRQIAVRLGQLGPKLANLYVPPANGAITVNYGSEFAGMISLPEPNRWTLPKFEEPLPDYKIVDADGKETVVPGSTHTGLLDLPRTTQTPSARNQARALVLRDSMGDSLSLYLQAAFHETLQINHHMEQPALAPNVPSLVDSYKPDVLIYVMTERYLDRVPGDLELWQAANAFDAADGQPVSAWTPQSAKDSPVRIEGDPAMGAAVSLYWPVQDSRAHVVRIDLHAEWSGQLQVQFYADGKPHVLGEQYVVGNNQLYFNLPPDVDGERVTVVRGPGSAAALLKRVDLRARVENRAASQ
jgi:hypothetical protein